jgi:D-xylose transport system substrate-binding protein
MFKKLGLWPLINLLLVATVVLASCAPTPTPAAVPTSAPATSAPQATSTTAPAATATTAPAATSAPAATATTAAAATATTAPAASANGKIAFLLPENKTARYESQDLPDFKAKLTALGFDVNANLIYSNANQDASAQQAQAEAALTNGAKVLVLDPVDSAAAASIADAAKAQGVPVIAYDRLITGSAAVSYYISFDNVKVGQLQAQSLMTALSSIAKPTIVMINGSPTDNNAKLFKQGAHSVFDPLVAAGKLTIAKEYDTPDWSPDQAQTEMTQALTALGNKVDGVYAANDGTAGGAIAAMKAAGLTPIPPITGQDAELAAIQRILVGQQYMTVYKAIKPEAEAAATLAYDLLTNTTVPSDMVTGTTNNGKIDVPSILLTPVAVTKDNVKTTVIADGFWTAAQVCTTDYAAACTAAGIQ